MKVSTAECGLPSLTPTSVMPSGNSQQRKPYCLAWKCDNRDCRGTKAEKYLHPDSTSNLRWIGLIPDNKWKTVRRVRDYHKAKTFIITFTLGGRLVASDMNLSPRDGLMIKTSEREILKRLRHEMTYGEVKCVSPRPPRVPSGADIVHIGDSEEDAIVVMRTGYNLVTGEIGDGEFTRRPGDQWTKKEAVTILRGEYDIASFRKNIGSKYLEKQAESLRRK